MILGRNDAFAVIGGAPNARIVEGHVSRISGLEIFVVSPTFDEGLEFGPVLYGGITPVIGSECIVAVMTGTTEAWLLSWSGPNAGGTPMIGAKLRSDVIQPTTPTIATNTKITFDHIVRTALGFIFPTTSFRQTGIVVPKTALYDISAQVSVIANSQSMSCFITVNGSALMTENHWASDYTGATFTLGVFNVDRQLHTRVMLTAGDVVELWYNQQTTAPQPANGTRTWLDVLLLEAGQGPAGATGPPGPVGPAGGSTGAPLAHATFTANVTISAASEVTANPVVTAPPVTCDGTNAIIIECFAPQINVGASASSFITHVLYEDGVSIGYLGSQGLASVIETPYLKRKITPTAGVHTYSWRAYAGASNGTIIAGVGGLGANPPGYIRITTNDNAGPQGPVGPQGPAGAGVVPLAPTAKSATYTAVAGDLVLTTNSFTVTLPAHSAGAAVGVKVTDARTGAAPLTITAPSGLIMGQGIGVASAGAASMVLGIKGAFVVLESDGTNWHVIAGEQDTGHIAFPFAAGEQDLAGHVASYRKRGDYVTLRGMTHFISGTAPWPIGTLPAGFRPLNSHYVLTQGSTAAGNGQNAQVLSIESTGAITLDNVAALNGWSGNFANLAPLAFHAVN